MTLWLSSSTKRETSLAALTNKLNSKKCKRLLERKRLRKLEGTWRRIQGFKG
jgi:hypothetical protein